MEYICGNCKKELDEEEFYYSLVEGQMYSCFCRKCTTAKLKRYKQKTSSDKAALWLVLAEMQTPFKAEAWNSAVEYYEQALKADKMQIYLKCLAALNKDGKYEGFWQSDVMLDEIITIDRNQVIASKDDVATLQRVWGEYDIADLRWLEEEYKEYMNSVSDDADSAMLKSYRNLCKANLRLKKANENNEDTKAITDEILKWLKLLGIDRFQTEAEKSEARLAFEKVIDLIEYHKPAEWEELEAYKDMCGYEKDKDEQMRCLRNAIVGTKDYPMVTEEM